MQNYNLDSKRELYVFINFLMTSKNKHHKGLIQEYCDHFIDKLKKEITEEILTSIKKSK